MSPRRDRAIEMHRLLASIFSTSELEDRDWLRAFALVMDDGADAVPILDQEHARPDR